MGKIKITLSNPQRDFCASPARFSLWRANRRQGKTNGAEYRAGKIAIKRPNIVVWYVAQDASLCKEMNVPLFEQIFYESGAIKSYSKSDRCFEMFNGSKVYFKTANSSDGLRGRKIHHLVCEEPTYWQNGHDIYHNILRPQLADTMGSCDIIFTPPTIKAPKGAEWVRRLEGMFKEEIAKGNKEYAVYHNTIYDSPFITEAERENLKRMTDPETWQCEYMAEYNDKQGQVYWEFDPLTRKTSLDPKEAVLMRVRGMDFGIADNTACIWISLLQGNRVHIEQEYIANNLDVPSHATAIKRLTTYPPQYTVLDSACWARDASLSSVAKRFAEQGIACLQATKDFDGSVSDMKRMMSNGLITVDPRCQGIINALASWQWGAHEDDCLAAMRYGIDALIRTGKLLPPIRSPKDDTRNVYQKMMDTEKAVAALNKKMQYRNFGIIGPAFKII